MPQRLAKISLVLAVFFLFFRPGGTLEAPNIKPSEFLISIAAVLILADLFKNRFRLPNGPEGSFQKILPGLGIFYASLIIGTGISLFKYNNVPIQFVGLEYLRISFAVILFLLIVLCGASDRKFLKWLFFAFLSPLAVAGISRIPGAIEALAMSDGGTRFRGFFSDPNYFANFSMIAAIFLFVMAQDKSLTIYKRLMAFLSGMAVMGLIFWSGSRSGWIGVFAGLTIAAILITRASQNKLRAGLIAALTLPLFIFGSFFLLNGDQKTDALGRLGYSIDFKSGILSMPASGLSAVLKRSIPTAYGQDRSNLWRQAAGYFRASPIGYGPGYYKIINITSPNLEHRPAHNIIIEIALTSGILGLILLAGAVYMMIRFGLRIAEIPDYIPIGTSAALTGVLLGSLFLDGLNLRWIWALGGMLLAYHQSLRRK